jgi:hypothetical protein
MSASSLLGDLGCYLRRILVGRQQPSSSCLAGGVNLAPFAEFLWQQKLALRAALLQLRAEIRTAWDGKPTSFDPVAWLAHC